MCHPSPTTAQHLLHENRSIKQTTTAAEKILARVSVVAIVVFFLPCRLGYLRIRTSKFNVIRIRGPGEMVEKNIRKSSKFTVCLASVAARRKKNAEGNL